MLTRSPSQGQGLEMGDKAVCYCYKFCLFLVDSQMYLFSTGQHLQKRICQSSLCSWHPQPSFGEPSSGKVLNSLTHHSSASRLLLSLASRRLEPLCSPCLERFLVPTRQISARRKQKGEPWAVCCVCSLPQVRPSSLCVPAPQGHHLLMTPVVEPRWCVCCCAPPRHAPGSFRAQLFQVGQVMARSYRFAPSTLS